MKANEVFPGNWLKAEDLGSTRPVVTIDRVMSEDLGSERKRVLYFRGKDKGLVLNKTNWNAIADILSLDDDDQWPGHRVRLYATKTEFQGKRVPCIRIEEASGNAKAAAPPEPEPSFDGDDDDTPF